MKPRKGKENSTNAAGCAAANDSSYSGSPIGLLGDDDGTRIDTTDTIWITEIEPRGSDSYIRIHGRYTSVYGVHAIYGQFIVWNNGTEPAYEGKPNHSDEPGDGANEGVLTPEYLNPYNGEFTVDVSMPVEPGETKNVLFVVWLDSKKNKSYIQGKQSQEITNHNE